MGRELRVVIPVDSEKVEGLLSLIKSLGYAAMVQSSAFSDIEIVVTDYEDS